MSPKEEADSEDLWQCGSCGKEFDSYEIARFHEDNECEVARRKEEEIARRKEEAASREKSEQRIAEEGEELDSFTYKSRESSERFPVLTVFVGISPWLTASVIIIFLYHGFRVSGHLGPMAGLYVFLAGLAIGIFIQVISELISARLDFHDATYINTKVRIETLEALQEISKKLKK